MAGVGDDEDVRVPVLPVPGRGQPGHDGAELAGGDHGGVVGGKLFMLPGTVAAGLDSPVEFHLDTGVAVSP